MRLICESCIYDALNITKRPTQFMIGDFFPHRFTCKLYIIIKSALTKLLLTSLSNSMYSPIDPKALARMVLATALFMQG